MRLASRLMLGSALAVLAMGCGGSDPGSGTKTLFVKAEIVTDGSTDGTRMAVEVRQGSESGELITDAIVSVRGDETGEVAVPWEGITWGDFKAGAYYREKFAWDTGWAIEVKRGNDYLEAYIEAPGVTTIMNPIANTVFRRGSEPLLVEWKDSAGHGAQVVEVDFDKADVNDTITNDDPFKAAIDSNRLVAADKERVEVRRRNEINLAGGAAGSIYRASTRHRIEFVVE